MKEEIPSPQAAIEKEESPEIKTEEPIHDMDTQTTQ